MSRRRSAAIAPSSSHAVGLRRASYGAWIGTQWRMPATTAGTSDPIAWPVSPSGRHSERNVVRPSFAVDGPALR
ncbi:MAG: hypothetical protein QM638_01750 [Nocardioides sp.]|uniref:hypothetical protein n=1 Tax=Nocardioides sp. TaxID=35761 RepID=UPI0039E664EA